MHVFMSCFSFIRLSDYLIVNTMHVLVVNSVEILLNYLNEQLQNIDAPMEQADNVDDKVYN